MEPATHSRWSLRTKLRVILLMLVLAAIGWFAIATGFWQPLLLSNILYSEPVPSRVVSPAGLDNGLDLKLELDGSAQARFHEQELTALFQRQENFPLHDPQVIVTTERMELFGSVPSQQQMKILATVVPIVEDGKLSLDIQEVRLGSVRVPAMVLGISSSVLSRVILDPLPATDHVERVELSEQVLTLDLAL